MKKIKLPRKLKKGLRLTKYRQTRAHSLLLNCYTKAGMTLEWLKLERLAKRFNESPYRLFEELGCVSFNELEGWEHMNARLPHERRNWDIEEGYLEQHKMKGE